MPNRPASANRRVVALVYDGLCTFEFGIAAEVFGLARPEMGGHSFAISALPVIIFFAAALACHLVLRHLRFGRHLYAVGGNAAAATLNGVATRGIVFSVYVIVGFFCGLAAMLLNARLNSAEAVAGMGLELDVIAAVVIGGTSLFGGVGGIGGTVVGALLIGVLRNGLVLLNVSSFIQQIIIGLVLVAAVAFDQYASRRRT